MQENCSEQYQGRGVGILLQLLVLAFSDETLVGAICRTGETPIWFVIYLCPSHVESAWSSDWNTVGQGPETHYKCCLHKFVKCRNGERSRGSWGTIELRSVGLNTLHWGTSWFRPRSVLLPSRVLITIFLLVMMSWIWRKTRHRSLSCTSPCNTCVRFTVSKHLQVSRNTAIAMLPSDRSCSMLVLKCKMQFIVHRPQLNPESSSGRNFMNSTHHWRRWLIIFSRTFATQLVKPTRRKNSSSSGDFPGLRRGTLAYLRLKGKPSFLQMHWTRLK